MPRPTVCASQEPELHLVGSELHRISMTDNLRIAPFSTASSIYEEFSPIPGLARLNFCTNPPPIKLPSLKVFDQGVNALARLYKTAQSQSFHSSFPRPRYRPIAPKPMTSTVVIPIHKTAFPKHANISNSYSSRIGGSPGPPPNKKKECVSRKGRYTTEEGDFIIYFWHDMELNWQEIETRFAKEFGPSRRRTVQSLQSQYYRMNDRIPLWDDDGRLIFEKEDDVQPMYTSIKCRERERQCRTLESLGLGQRYPERAIGYSWVDDESKRKWRDWGEFDSHWLRTNN